MEGTGVKAYISHTESIKFLCGLCYTKIICAYQKYNYIYKHNESRRKIAVHVKKWRFMPKGGRKENVMKKTV